MRIAVKRTGGFAGLTEDIGEVDTTQLDASAAQQVEQMVSSLGFFELPATIAAPTIGADLFRYEITVSDGSRRHAVTFADDGGPEAAPLRDLVQTVAEMG
jgi:hypothetical protein